MRKMGRVKTRVERIGTPLSRRVTYSKRKAGVMKKARELATLCDIDLAVLAFSPNGKPTLHVGERSDLASVVGRFANMTLTERSNSKHATIEGLQKSFKNADHEIDPRKFLDDGRERVEELNCQLKQLQEKFVGKTNKLSAWLNPNSVNDLVQIKTMENILMESLNELQKKKDHLMELRMRKSSSASKVRTLKLFGCTISGFSHQHDLECLENTAQPNENGGETVEPESPKSSEQKE